VQLLLLVRLTRSNLRRHMDQGAGIGIFQHPQRTIGAFLHIADAMAPIPALGGFGTLLGNCATLSEWVPQRGHFTP
jgi:hypothetical protein